MSAMQVRERIGNLYPYDRFMESEGLPVHRAMGGVDDVTQLPRKPWARTGGLATFIQMVGTFEAQRGVYVAEIPGGGALNPEKHLYEEEIFILEGRGLTEVTQPNGSKVSFEWGEGSVFAFPRNVTHRLVNGSREPAIFLAVTTAPAIINDFDDVDYVFNSAHQFDGLAGRGSDYFATTDVKTREGSYDQYVWHTNFIPDCRVQSVDPLEIKVAGGSLTGYRMGKHFPHGHISEWPSGRYHKAHYHGPGAILLGLTGKGYVNLWSNTLGMHPYADGHGDKVVKVEWGPKSIYCPPNGWFHQHMNTSGEPARHIAVYGSRSPLGFTRSTVGDDADGDSMVMTPVQDGGSLINYENEDPFIRQEFEERLKAAGVEMNMPPVTYAT